MVSKIASVTTGCVICHLGLTEAGVNQQKYFQKYLNKPHKTIIVKDIILKILVYKSAIVAYYY